MGFFDKFMNILRDFETEILKEVDEKLKQEKEKGKKASDYVAPYANMQNIDGVLKDLDGEDIKVNDITDELKIVLTSSGNYPKIFTKGITAHGYNNGQRVIEKINFNTETTKTITTNATSRLYGRGVTNNAFDTGYTFGGDTDHTGKLNLVTETESNISIFNNDRSGTFMTKNIKKLVTQENGKYTLFNESNETTASDSKSVSNYGYSGAGWWHKEKAFLQGKEYNFGTNTEKSISNWKDSHHWWITAYKDWAFLEDHKAGYQAHRYRYNFTTYTSSTSPNSVRSCGYEIQLANGNNMYWVLGGYNGKQHGMIEKIDEFTGVSVSGGNLAYHHSSSAVFSS